MINQIEPWIDNSELDELKRVIESTFVVEHKLTAEFEDLTLRLTGAKHSVAMTNGTMALFSCLKALGIGYGDEVIVPNITFVASANAVILAGATPVFCEICPDTFCIDINYAKKLVNSKTKAIMPVHLYGQSADMDKIMLFASEFNLDVVEDAAQGVGVSFNNRHVGTFGKLGVLSYYGNKTITCGEGGIVLTNDNDLAAKCYRLKNHGRSVKGVFEHEEIGFNFSFTEMQAAIGIAQMKKLDRIIKKKQEINDLYIDALGNISKKFIPAFIDPRCKPVYWFTSFLCTETDQMATYLKEKGIQTRRFFYPLHLQPCYKDRINKENIDLNDGFKISERIYKQGISLPSSYNLTLEDQQTVIKHIKEYLCA